MDTAFLSFRSTLPEDACRLPNTPGAFHPLPFGEMVSPKACHSRHNSRVYSLAGLSPLSFCEVTLSPREAPLPFF